MKPNRRLWGVEKHRLICALWALGFKLGLINVKNGKWFLTNEGALFYLSYLKKGFVGHKNNNSCQSNLKLVRILSVFNCTTIWHAFCFFHSKPNMAMKNDSPYFVCSTLVGGEVKPIQTIGTKGY